MKRQKLPILRFSPTAWAKLVYLRDLTQNEVGGFGICDADDLLFIKDIAIVKQTVSVVTVAFDDNAVADFFADQVEAGRKPEQFARVWLHTHPGSSASPSSTDEDTFYRVFGSCDWSVMGIVAQDGGSYARLRFNTGPGGELKIPVAVEYGCEFEASKHKQWKAEYLANVKEDRRISEKRKTDKEPKAQPFGFDEKQIAPAVPYDDMLNELDAMHPSERQAFFDELSCRSEFWDEETEVFYG
jgi:proteasome lid subunit RPN8/RPN11